MKTKLMSLILLAGLGSMPTTNFAAKAPTADGLTHRKNRTTKTLRHKEAARQMNAGSWSKPVTVKAALVALTFIFLVNNYSLPTSGTKRLSGRDTSYSNNRQYDLFHRYELRDKSGPSGTDGHVYYSPGMDPHGYLDPDYEGNLRAECCASRPDDIDYLFNPILSKMEEEDCRVQDANFGPGFIYHGSAEKLFLYRVYLLTKQYGYASQFTDAKGRVNYLLVSNFVKTITDLRQKKGAKKPEFSDTCSGIEGLLRKSKKDNCSFTVNGKVIIVNKAIIRTIDFLWEKEHPTKTYSPEAIDRGDWDIVSERNTVRLTIAKIIENMFYEAAMLAKQAEKTDLEKKQKNLERLAEAQKRKARKSAHFNDTRRGAPHQGAKINPRSGQRNSGR